MACTDCDKNIWQQKLGRCKRCMWLNFMLFIVSTVLSYFMWQTEPKSVQTIAMLFTCFGSTLLMLLHIIAFLYYRFVRGDIHSLK